MNQNSAILISIWCKFYTNVLIKQQAWNSKIYNKMFNSISTEKLRSFN